MSSIRFERSVGLAAAAFLAFALPAQATNTASSTSAANANQPAATAQRTDQADRERQICVRMELSGSHVTRRVCKTAQEWERAGGLPTDDR